MTIFFPLSHEQPEWLAYTCYVCPDLSVHEHPYDRAHRVAQALQQASLSYQQTSIFLLPESTWPYAMNEYPHILSWWFNELPQNAWLCFGGHRYNNKKLYNALLVTHNAKDITTYDKKILFPYVEYLPSAWEWLEGSIISSFFHDAHFTPALPVNLESSFCAWCPMKPLICSELFCFTTGISINNRPKALCLCIVNDSWFTLDYMRNLMYLYAKIRALSDNHAYIYISHDRGMYINESGYECALNSWHYRSNECSS